MGNQLKHNKRRNVGLAYEMLVREVSAAAVTGDRRRAAQAAEILARHMGPGSSLGEELSVHQRVLESRGCSPTAARRIVDELRAAGIRLTARSEQRDRAKTAMIHEMNRALGPSIWDHRIPDYKAHASIGMVLSRGLGRRVDEGVGMVQVEEALATWLSSPRPASPVFDRDATALAYNNAVKIFEEELGRDLLDEQKDLLREQVRADLGGNREPLHRTYERHRDGLRRFLERSRADKAFREDSEMGKLLEETIVELRSPGEPTEEGLERLMQMMELRREIES